ncbi:non-ribosomal peptide synthetase [Amycolatopsis sp. NBC_00438]|uniref:non-ribosomal peptide synthetase n=1 Tax=Amycolatopsis sp. NBC_00438 TaxID=2903558 RepID=UPI002E2380FC
MWLLERLVPDSAANNLSLAFQVEGRLEVPALRAALDTLLRRYEVLRTVYVATGADLLKGVVPPDEFRFELELPPAPLSDVDVERALRPFVTRPFALDGAPLLRAGLFEHAGGHVLCLAFHHLIYDIISGRRLYEDLVAAYEGFEADDAPPAQLHTVVPGFAEPEPKPESLAYWRQRLGDFDPKGLGLACGVPDDDEPTMAGDQVTFTLSPRARAAVRELQREARAPEAVILLAAYHALLAAHGAGPDIAVGTPVSVRPKDDPDAVGHHTNVLPIRLALDPGEGFRALARRARDTYFGALLHADVPVDCYPELVPRVDSTWRNRLCRHLFNYFPQLALGSGATVAGRPARMLVVENGYSKFDLEFGFASSADELRVIARHATGKLDRADVEALLLRYDALLVACGADPDRPIGDIPVWSEQDHAVIDAANDTARTHEPESVVAAVYGHVLRAPDAVAVEQGVRTTTYRQVWDTAVATRELLLGAGVTAGDTVAIAVPRSPELVAAVLGLWLTGVAYVPVDPGHPAQRTAYVLADSGAKLVLTGHDLAVPGGPARLAPLPVTGAAPAGPPVEPPRIDPGAAAYLIYTSGSSGRPKGAVLPHRAITNIAGDYTERLPATPRDATLWMTTFAFDMANLEHYVPLYSGGRIVVAPDEARTDGAVLRALIERHDPRIIQATPTTWRLVLDRVADRLAGRKVVTGAEPVPVALVRALLATGCEVHHAYGPTETTTWCTWGVIEEVGERLDVGKPIANTRVAVVAPDGRELPVGVRGELWIAGDGVALGYHGSPELTAAKFVEHPVHGRCYRSGDLGRWLPDGTLELFGRADRQVKLRGNRIELGEVEAALLGHPLVRAAAAVVVGDRSADGRLVVFVESDVAGLADELWEYARTELPHSAIPQDFFVVDALPVNANEKVDYPALEQRALTTRPGEGGHVDDDGADPSDELVLSLIELFRRLLDRDDVAAETNFFTNGGNSLLGARLLQEIEETTRASVKLPDLFAAPTPAALAKHVRTL